MECSFFLFVIDMIYIYIFFFSFIFIYLYYIIEVYACVPIRRESAPRGAIFVLFILCKSMYTHTRKYTQIYTDVRTTTDIHACAYAREAGGKERC